MGKMKMIKFRARYGKELVEQLLMCERENVNLDGDDNLRSVFLTAKEIFYLIACIRKTEGDKKADYKEMCREINLQIRHHQAEGNSPAVNSLTYVKQVMKGGNK